jgi:cyclopropane-fatty-acyl-phospholipid synthase
MNLIARSGRLAERTPLPDFLIEAGIRGLCTSTDRALSEVSLGRDARFAAEMAQFPVALHPDAANAQHYELPPEFFSLVLGPRRKYSSCLYPHGDELLAEAEDVALGETVRHAGLADGQSILELGCGWGSLSLWMAEQYPLAHITAVSNSAAQRTYIEAVVRQEHFSNLRVITADMNDFETRHRFDRIVSVEMFEHMANWRMLLGRARHWLKEDGRLFLHVFTHRHSPYRFDHGDTEDWIAQHFFTGGIMPSHGLIRQFDDLFQVEEEWRWSGLHYEKTARQWLANFDHNVERIGAIFRDVYRADAPLWRRRWRMFFLATAGLFGHEDGSVWGVSHYRLKPA